MTPPESAKISPTADRNRRNIPVPTSVNFYGVEIPCCPHVNKLWVALRPICIDLGIDPASQQVKLRGKTWAATDVISTSVDSTDGRARKMFMLDLDCLPMWLASLSENAVRPEFRGKLIRYQHECVRALRDAVFGAAPTAAPALPPAPTLAPPSLLDSALIPELVAELREAREDRKQAREKDVVFFQSLTAIVQMVGRMTEKSAPQAPVPALPAAPSVPVQEKEWVTMAEACLAIGLNFTTIYQRLRQRNALKTIRRKELSRKGSLRGGSTNKLWHLADLRAALAAPIPDRKWEPPAPAQAALQLAPVIPIKTETKPAAQFVPDALRDAVLYTMRSHIKRAGLSCDAKHRLWVSVYDLFSKRFRYDPRKLHGKKQRAIDYVEQRGDMAGLLMCAQEVCAEESGQEQSA